MTAPLDPSGLLRFGTLVLEGLGMPAADAALLADSLVTADLWGHESHGLLRLPWYAARLRSGVMTAVTAPEILTDLGALALIDGRDGVGQIVTDRACTEAVRRAREHGIGAVAVRDSNHFGTAAYFTRRIAQEGCVGILTTNGSPAMAPWGGTVKSVGANPWSIAAPDGTGSATVLDIANTAVARGKIYAAAQHGASIPEGWALDADGLATTDPQAAIEGLIAPMSGHKGYGISFMMDVLSGVLTGSGYSTDVVGPYVPDERSRCGHLVMAIDISRLLPLEEFDARMRDLVARTKAVPRAHGVEEIFCPGELEDRAEERTRREGVRLAPGTLEDLNALGESCGVSFEDVVQEGAR